MLPKSTTMISIPICTRDRAPSLAQTLESLAATSIPEGETAELIVVDNGSTDATPETVSGSPVRQMPVRHIFEPRLGLSHARNRALAEARGEILLFTDDDVRVPQDWIERMIQPIRNRSVDAVAGGVELAAHLQRPWQTDVLRTWLVSGFPPTGDLWGANMAFHRRVLGKVAGFDTELGAGALGFGEETLFAHQLLAAGFRIGGADVTVLHHPDERRISEADLLGAAEKRGRSHAYIAHHWHHQKPDRPHIRLAMLRLKRALREMLSRPSEAPRLWLIFYTWHAGRHAEELRLRGTPRRYQTQHA